MTTRAAFTNCSWITGNTEVAGAMPTYQTSRPQPNVPKQAHHPPQGRVSERRNRIAATTVEQGPDLGNEAKAFSDSAHTSRQSEIPKPDGSFATVRCRSMYRIPFQSIRGPGPIFCWETDAAASSVLHGVPALQRYRPAAPDCSHQRASASRLQQSLGVCHGPPTRRT